MKEKILAFFKSNGKQYLIFGGIALVLLSLPIIVAIQAKHQSEISHAAVALGDGQNYQICTNQAQYLTSPWTYHVLVSGSQTYTVSQYKALSGYGISLPPLPDYIASQSANTTAAVIFAPGSTVSQPAYNYPNTPLLYFFEGGSYGSLALDTVSGDEFIGGSAPGFPEPQFDDGGNASGINGQNGSNYYSGGTSKLAAAANAGATTITTTTAIPGYIQYFTFSDGTTYHLANANGTTYTLDTPLTSAEAAGQQVWANQTSPVAKMASAGAQGAKTVSFTSSSIPMIQWQQVNIGDHNYTLTNVTGSQAAGYTATIDGLDIPTAANTPVYFSDLSGGVTVSYLDIAHDSHNTTGTIYTGAGWTITHNNIHDGYMDTSGKATPGLGVAVYGGDQGTVEYNCFSKMGDYAINIFGTNNKFDYNEVFESNYLPDPGCGCSGGGKWWGTLNADIVSNAFINDAPGESPPIWLDNGNSGTNISGNYFERSTGAAVESETGFNLSITNNVFQDGGWGDGTGPGDSNSVGAIGLNSSGGFHVPGSRYDNQIVISGNQFTNNWGGVGIWQSGSRSCENSGEGWPYDAPYCSGGYPNTANTNAGGQYYFSHYADSSNSTNSTVAVAASAGSSTVTISGSQAINDQIGFADPAKTTTTSTTDVSTFNGSQTITAATTANFPSSGQLRVGTSDAWSDGNGSWTGAILAYTGTTATSFTGVSLVRGAGTLSGPVWQVQPYKVLSETCGTNDCAVTVSPALTSDVSIGANVTNAGTCQLYATAGTSPSSPLAPDGTSYFDGCQWGTKNISITGNTFSFDPVAIAAGTTVNGHVGTSCTASHTDYCGTNFMAFQVAGEPPFETFIGGNAMMSNSNLTGCPSWDSGCTSNPLANINALSNPPSAPAHNNEPSENIVWSNNIYNGPWSWNTDWYGNCGALPSDPATGHSMPSGACSVDFALWQSDWMQDAGSSYNGNTPTSGAPTPTTVTIPTPTALPTGVPTPKPTSAPTKVPTPTNPIPTLTPLPLYSSAGFPTWNSAYDKGNRNMISATQVTTGANGGTLQSITVYLGKAGAAPSNHIQAAIYTDNGKNAPGTLLASSTTHVIAPKQWNTIAIVGVTIKPNTKYFLVFNVDSANTQYGWNNKRKGISRWKSNVNFGTWLSSFGNPTYAANQQYAIFMTYK